MNWLPIILQAITSILEGCDMPQKAERAGRRRKGRLVIRRAVKQAGVPRSERADARAELFEELETMDEDDIDEFVGVPGAGGD